MNFAKFLPGPSLCALPRLHCARGRGNGGGRRSSRTPLPFQRTHHGSPLLVASREGCARADSAAPVRCHGAPPRSRHATTRMRPLTQPTYFALALVHGSFSRPAAASSASRGGTSSPAFCFLARSSAIAFMRSTSFLWCKHSLKSSPTSAHFVRSDSVATHSANSCGRAAGRAAGRRAAERRAAGLVDGVAAPDRRLHTVAGCHACDGAAASRVVHDQAGARGERERGRGAARLQPSRLRSCSQSGR